MFIQIFHFPSYLPSWPFELPHVFVWYHLLQILFRLPQPQLSSFCLYEKWHRRGLNWFWNWIIIPSFLMFVIPFSIKVKNSSSKILFFSCSLSFWLAWNLSKEKEPGSFILSMLAIILPLGIMQATIHWSPIICFTVTFTGSQP